ncbi:MAG: hemin receptor [Gammaproteobacteria bacterium]|nr:hemin receptor [Gammaproteobacteria bacterium]
MSLTQQQIHLIQSSFAKVKPSAMQAAEIFYDTLFEYDPSLESIFHGDMKSQGEKLMRTLDTAVSSLSNLDALLPVLEALAVRHVQYQVQPKDYTTVGNALLATLSKGLGDEFTPVVRQAWVDGFRLIAKVMKSAAYPDAA